MQFEQKNRRRAAALSGVGIFLMGALFGAYLLVGFPQLQQQIASPENSAPEPTERAEIAAAPAGETVLDNAKVEWIGRFAGCGHELALPSGGSLAGMDKKAAGEAFPGYIIEFFDSENVRLVKSFEHMCPEHYTIKLYEGALVITKTDPETYEYREIMRIAADVEGLDALTLSALEKGVSFSSLSDINSFLESAE